MKKLLLFAALTGFGIHILNAQDSGTRSQRTLTNPTKGYSIEVQPVRGVPPSHPAGPVDAPLAPGVNWTVTDGASIDNVAKTSDVSLNTVAGWGLNDQRLSLYSNSNTPVW